MGDRGLSIRGPAGQSSRLRAALIAFACVGLLAAIAAPGASAVKTASLEYKGHLVVEQPAGLETEGANEHNFGQAKIELSWVATATSPIQAEFPKPPEWNFQTLQGTLHEDSQGEAHPEPSCDATLSRRSDAPGFGDSFWVEPRGAEESEVEVFTGIPLSEELLQSSDEDPNSSCSVAGLSIFDEYETPGGETEREAREDGVEEALKLAIEPRFTATASGLQSAPFDVSWSRESPPGAGGTPYRIEVVSSITVGTSTSTTETATPPAGPPPGTSTSSTTTTNESTAVAKILGAKIDSAAHKATFRFDASGKGVKFECKLSGKGRAKFAACHSPQTYRRLKPGHYVFFVRARGSGKSGPAVERHFSIGRR